MPKPDLSKYNPFERWPDGLHTDVKFLGGSTLALMSVALRHYYPTETSTAVDLRDQLVRQQGDNVAWIPKLKGVVEVFDKLNEGPGPEISARPSSEETSRALSYDHLGKIAYVGVVFDLCKNNPELYPQAVIGRAAKRLPGREMQPNPRPSARLSLYALLGTSEEVFTIPEIRQALKLGDSVGNHMVETPAQQGILTVERHGRPKPTLVQYTDAYREPMMDFSANIEALGTSKGIENGLRMAESAINDPAQVSHIMALGNAWAAGQAKVLTRQEVPPLPTDS